MLPIGVFIRFDRSTPRLLKERYLHVENLIHACLCYGNYSSLSGVCHRLLGSLLVVHPLSEPLKQLMRPNTQCGVPVKWCVCVCDMCVIRLTTQAVSLLSWILLQLRECACTSTATTPMEHFRRLKAKTENNNNDPRSFFFLFSLATKQKKLHKYLLVTFCVCMQFGVLLCSFVFGFFNWGTCTWF